jgi:hypothetical protein
MIGCGFHDLVAHFDSRLGRSLAGMVDRATGLISVKARSFHIRHNRSIENPVSF